MMSLGEEMKFNKTKHSFIGVIAAAIGGGIAYISSSPYFSVGADTAYIESDISKNFIYVIVGIALLFIGIFYLVLASSR